MLCNCIMAKTATCFQCLKKKHIYIAKVDTIILDKSIGLLASEIYYQLY